MCVYVTVGDEGIIKGWTEQYLNMTQAVEYNAETGTFKVVRRGVYFLYCQVRCYNNSFNYSNPWIKKKTCFYPTLATFLCLTNFFFYPITASPSGAFQ